MHEQKLGDGIVILLKNKSKSSEDLNDFRINNTEDLPYSFSIVDSPVFGKTLQIQSIPKKICPGDCIYCPYGRTTHQLVDRESFYSIKKTISEICELLKLNDQIKYIVICGPGEPTLNADLNWLIDSIKKFTSLPIAVNTCGSLLWRISVQKDLLKSNATFVNIDAADRAVYHCINRFHQLIPYDRYIEGIINFHNAFAGDFYVRVCLLDGINTQETHFYKLAALVKRLNPKAVFVSTDSLSIDKSHTFTINDEQLQKFASYFGPSAQIFDMDAAFNYHSQFTSEQLDH